eukprot:scaffold19100_cov36-Phaeocystis_antarctica.AAC.2
MPVENPCALGEASVRRHALPTRSPRSPGTGGRALPPEESSSRALGAAAGRFAPLRARVGEASVRRRALPTRSLRSPGTGRRALPPKEGSGGASRAATGPKGEISP